MAKAITTNTILSFLDIPNLFINEGSLVPSNITANTKSKVKFIAKLFCFSQSCLYHSKQANSLDRARKKTRKSESFLLGWG